MYMCSSAIVTFTCIGQSILCTILSPVNINYTRHRGIKQGCEHKENKGKLMGLVLRCHSANKLVNLLLAFNVLCMS